MKKLLGAVFFLAVLIPSAQAAQAGKLSGGVVIGDPIGPTLKYWMTDTQALDVTIGFEDDPVFFADYLWHSFRLVPQPSGGKVGLYAGVGPWFQVTDHGDDKVAARVPFGINFLMNKAPIEFFAELAPVFQFSPDSDSDVDAGVGVRFLFGGM